LQTQSFRGDLKAPRHVPDVTPPPSNGGRHGRTIIVRNKQHSSHRPARLSFAAAKSWLTIMLDFRVTREFQVMGLDFVVLSPGAPHRR
jgi:hypothetical protein